MPNTLPMDLSGPEPALIFVPTANGVEQVLNYADAIQRVRLQLAGVRLTVTAALDYGSVELGTFPDKNFIVLGSEANVVITKGGVTNGIVAATDLDVALGTAPASATTLATTMLNILPKQDLDTDALSVTLAAHSLAATPVLTGILDAPDNKLYFNAVPIGGITADDSLLLTGTIDLFVIDLGNVTS